MRNKGIDYIRACMAILIMLYHYTTRYGEMVGNIQPYSFRISNGGTVGVAVFFIISAMFVLKKSYETNFNLLQFMKRKFLRLYPAYFVCMTITFIALTVFPVEGLTVGFKSYLLNLTLIQRFIGAAAVDGAHWYIAFLLVFYFWIGMFCLLKLQYKKSIYIVWLFLSTVFSSTFWSNIGVPNIINLNSKIEALLNIVFLGQYSSYVIIGVMLFLVANHLGKKSSCIAIMVVCFIRNIFFIGLVNTFIIFALFLLVIVFYTDTIKIGKIGLLEFLASISYPLYLIHQNVGYLIINRLEQHGFLSELYLVVPIAVSIAIAAVVTYGVEKPIQKWIKRASL